MGRHCILVSLYCFAISVLETLTLGVFKNKKWEGGENVQYLHDAVFWAMDAALMRSDFWVCIITPAAV